MPTTIPAAKLALVALLEAVAWPGNDPEIRYGHPTEGEDTPFGGELVFLGETRIQSPLSRMGSGMRDETFNLRFVVDVRQEGDNEPAVEARAWVLYEAAVAAVVANPTISGTVNRIAQEGISVSQVNVFDPQAWRTQIVVDVAVVGLAS